MFDATLEDHSTILETSTRSAPENGSGIVDLVQDGPLPVTNQVITPTSRVITPVTHLKGHL